MAPRDHYPNGICPNCKTYIPEDATWGTACKSCGFSFPLLLEDVVPTGRITYRKLLEVLSLLSSEQLDCDVTVEIETVCGNDCQAAELRICGPEHDSLEENHPVFYVPMKSL